MTSSKRPSKSPGPRRVALREDAAGDARLDEFFRAVVRHSPKGIAFVEERDRIRYRNATFRKLFSNVRDKEPRLSSHFQWDSAFASALTILEAAGGFHGLLRGVAKGSEVNVYEVTFHRWPGLPDHCFTALVDDVTLEWERQREEREWFERYDLAVRVARDGVWDWNLQTGEIYFSSRWKSMLGHDDDDLVNSLATWQKRVHPDDRAAFDEFVRSLRTGELEIAEWEHRLRKRDNSYAWMLARGAGIKDSLGVVYRLAGSLSDISERKRAEDDALHRQAELAHVHRVRTATELATGIAHELLQPITAIANESQGSLRRLQPLLAGGPGDSQAALASLQRITEQSLRAGQIVHRLKQLVTRRPPRSEVVDLNVIVTQAVEVLAQEIRRHQVECRHGPWRRPLEVVVDPVLILQVVLNVLRNAIEALASVEDRPRRLRISVLEKSHGFEIEVKDNGPGIPSDLANRLFEPFVSTKSGGLGMGLSLCRSMLESMKGTIHVDGSTPRGTRVRIRLPHP